MSAVILAADAFSFLFAWEFMSLSSWALVMVYHQDADNRRAGYVYIVMASFGTLALLLAFGLLAGPTGSYAFAEMRDAQEAVWLPGLVLGLALLVTTAPLSRQMGSLNRPVVVTAGTPCASAAMAIPGACWRHRDTAVRRGRRPEARATVAGPQRPGRHHP